MVPLKGLKAGLAALLLSVLLFGCGSDDDTDQNTINFGVFNARFGTPVLSSGQAAFMAAQEINQQGGLNGREIKLIIRDSGCDALNAVEEIERMIAQDNIVGLIGPTCSAVANVLIDQVLPVHNLPAIGISTTSPTLSTQDVDDLYYRVRLSDEAQNLATLDEVIADDVTRLGIIHRGGNDSFNIALADGLAQLVNNEAGRQVVAQISYPETTQVDFTDEVDALFDAGPLDGIAIFGFTSDTSNLAVSISQEMIARGIDRSAILGVYTNDELRGNSISQESHALDFLHGSKAIRSNTVSAANAPNLAQWELDFAQVFPGYSPRPQGYDALYLMALAIEQAQALGEITSGASSAQLRSAIKSHLREVSGTYAVQPASLSEINPGEFSMAQDILASGGSINYEGATGPIDFDHAGDINHGDLSVIQTVRVGNELQFNCLKEVRIFVDNGTVTTEQNPCE